ncbi:sterol desaturase family protein [Pedobacter polaris]|uniref:Sterol desaturase family protein n=1 Tax=Pedobacter polaris TaxID=2571273 RepID=A0A4U1CHY2_9SPHI|nr:sterol desaturase family protein [Pedobacter polaris]TKC06488.1 sterol desaturase family protein [Pedobacter polaris]
MENINYLAFAIPAFFLFLYIEYVLAVRLKKAHLFKYESSISNVSIGIAERLLNLFIAASFYDLFNYVYKHYALLSIPNTWWVWILLIMATDLVWYWYHRLGHEVNFFWAAHIVHHQSEEFNLTVSARITTFQALIRSAFWCALPFVGFHPAMVITILTVHGAYSFFTHTQLIPRLRWLEHILVTPSLHGIHHASDEKYLDKNYGDVFVFWDKIFGTYQREEEPPKYGLTHPIKSYSFLWQHFHYYFEIAEATNRVVGFKNKLKVIFGHPAVLNQDIRPLLEQKYLQHKSKDTYRFKFKKYLNIQIVVCVIMLTFLTAYFKDLNLVDQLFFLVFIIITLINCGALMEQIRWIYYLECIRLILIISFIFFKLDWFGAILLPTISLVILERFFTLSRLYKRYVLQYEKIKK